MYANIAQAVTWISAFWFWGLAFRAIKFIYSTEYLRAVALPPARTAWPRLSLIIPACDEASTLEASLRSRSTVDYPNLELIVVNDRSRDATGRIIERLAHGDSRIRPVHIKRLPEGWLGKVHALDRGTQIATGEWLIFSDADVHFSPLSLRKAVIYAEEAQIDFLTVLPDLVSPTWPLRVFIAQFLHLMMLGYSRQRLQNSRREEAIGAGVFNMVRRTVYERTEGFSGLKLEVVDDGALAWLIKRAGGRPALLSGIEELSLAWYRDLPDLIHGAEKNGFALFQYSGFAVTVFAVGAWTMFGMTVGWPLAVSVDWPARAFHALALAGYLGASGAALARTLRQPAWLALTLPFSFVLFPLIIVRSAYLCHRRGGIVWRGTFYPLALLRREQRWRMFDVIRRDFRV